MGTSPKPLCAIVTRPDVGPDPQESIHHQNRRSVTDAVKGAFHLGHKTQAVESVRVEMILLMPSPGTAAYFIQDSDNDKWEDDQLPDLVLGCKEVVWKEHGAAPTV